MASLLIYWDLYLFIYFIIYLFIHLSIFDFDILSPPYMKSPSKS